MRVTIDDTILVSIIDDDRAEHKIRLLCSESDRMKIAFPEWRTMLECIKTILAALKVDYVRLD